MSRQSLSSTSYHGYNNTFIHGILQALVSFYLIFYNNVNWSISNNNDINTVNSYHDVNWCEFQHKNNYSLLTFQIQYLFLTKWIENINYKLSSGALKQKKKTELKIMFLNSLLQRCAICKDVLYYRVCNKKEVCYLIVLNNYKF